jgi:hypothetical protein
MKNSMDEYELIQKKKKKTTEEGGIPQKEKKNFSTPLMYESLSGRTESSLAKAEEFEAENFTVINFHALEEEARDKAREYSSSLSRELRIGEPGFSIPCV